MKKTILILTLLTALAFGGRATAQDLPGRSNGTLEILAVYPPDFVAVKVADGNRKQIKRINASFLTKSNQTCDTGYFRAVNVSVFLDKEGSMDTKYTENTEFWFSNFNAPNLFEANRIKFVVDGVEMYYDIENSRWEEYPE